MAEERTRARLRGMCRALGEALGGEARGRIVSDYPALLAAIRNREIDLAWMPPVVALRASSAGVALPIGIPVRDGVATFYTALFTRADSPYRRPSDLVQVRAAWVDRQSASGYLIIRAALRAQGVNLDQAIAEEHVVGSHAAVVDAVRSGRVDVGATYVHPVKGKWWGCWGDMDVHTVARVGPIPNDVIAAGAHVPSAQVRLIGDALIENEVVRMATLELIEADGIVRAEGSHFDELTRLLAYLDNPAATTRHHTVPRMRRSKI